MIVYLHVPKCAGNSTSFHLRDNIDLYTFMAYTKFIRREITETISSSGNFERMKAYLEHPSTVTGSPDVISGIGVFKGIESYFTPSGSVSTILAFSILLIELFRCISLEEEDTLE